MSDLFEKASRLKLRFPSPLGGGGLTVEQLWDLQISSRAKNSADLTSIARELNRRLKDSSTDDDLPWLSSSSKADNELQLAFDIVKHVVETKKAEAEKAAETAANREKKQQILALIAAKETEELGGKSLDDLRKLAAEL
ncbi:MULTISPECIES: hypothetical protein [unclassified Bradyrhizobium]|uniref:hypothetical protein n=1 Tax=unclassified Bradyrhizobium TaxID=2631580 RepID=UPI0028E7369C|nr:MULTISPECIES: hypothetical protein [unclassified Bradyrhizobium]